MKVKNVYINLEKVAFSKACTMLRIIYNLKKKQLQEVSVPLSIIIPNKKGIWEMERHWIQNEPWNTDQLRLSLRKLK